MLPNEAENASGATPIAAAAPQGPRPRVHRAGSHSAPSKKISLPLGTLGQPVELSVPWEDLSCDEFIVKAPRVTVAGHRVPALGGIPLFYRLGVGGMGAVYYGIHRGFAHEVAVKVLPFHLAQTQPDLIERFFREARIASKINSDHLVRVTDVGQDGALSFLVMEYVHGKSAAAILEIGRSGGALGLDEAMALDICIAACKGLAAAHANAVIHRDVKPDNILIPVLPAGRDYNVNAGKLADLGLARCEGLHQTVTVPEFCLGSPGYMAPEQIDDTRHAGKQADVFSLGATLYVLLCGMPPFTGDTHLAIMRATARPHRPLSLVRPDISRMTSDAIDICLAKAPADRYADGAALLKVLVACRAGLSDPQAVRADVLDRKRVTISERRNPAPAHDALTSYLSVQNNSEQSCAEKTAPRIERPRRANALWILPYVAALALLLAGIVALTRRIQEPAPARKTREFDAAGIDALERDGDAHLAENDRARQFEKDAFARKVEGLKAAEQESARQRESASAAALAEFEDLLNQATAADARSDWARAGDLLLQARRSPGLALSARKTEFEDLTKSVGAHAKKSGVQRKYRALLDSIVQTVGAEPLDDFGHCFLLDANRRARLGATLRAAEYIDAAYSVARDPIRARQNEPGRGA